jgi:hypothetical protein
MRFSACSFGVERIAVACASVTGEEVEFFDVRFTISLIERDIVFSECRCKLILVFFIL